MKFVKDGTEYYQHFQEKNHYMNYLILRQNNQIVKQGETEKFLALPKWD